MPSPLCDSRPVSVMLPPGGCRFCSIEEVQLPPQPPPPQLDPPQLELELLHEWLEDDPQEWLEWFEWLLLEEEQEWEEWLEVEWLDPLPECPWEPWPEAVEADALSLAISAMKARPVS